MDRWLISVPAWGRHVEVFCAAALPALTRAVEVLCQSCQVDARVVIHTDRPDRVLATADPSILELRALPAGLRDFDCMSQAHREVLGMACRGDVVVLLTAGAVISAGGLCYCHDVLTNPQLRVVLCAVPRVLEEGKIPETEDAAEFMRWAWAHRHPIVDDCTWPAGLAADLSRTYYTSDEGRVVTRQCLPHPLAVRIDGRELGFVPTVDTNLIHRFDPMEMHIVPDCSQLALVKLTPRGKLHQLAKTSMRARLAAGELVISDPIQRYLLSKSIRLVDEPGDCGDAEVVSRIVAASGG